MKSHRIIILLSATILVTAMSAKAEDPVNIPDPALKAAVMEALGLTTDPTPTDMLALASLDASARGITDLTGLEYGKNLVMLSLSSNLISDIQPLRDLTLLTNLDLASNRIAAIEPLIALTGLTELGLRNNLVTDIGPLSSLTNLVLLDLHSDGPTNQITDISALANMVNMQDLYLAGNPIRDINVLANLTRLGVLDLDRTQVTDITPVAGLTGLWRLFLNLDQISDLSPVAGLTNLAHLALEGNPIVDIRPLAGLTNLTELDLGRTLITDLTPLAGLTDLAFLRLHDNWLTDIQPLAGLTNLAELWLSGNPLPARACAIDIPLIKANNPGIVIYYDGCVELPPTFTVSSTAGGSVVMPGEGTFTYPYGKLAPVEAVADEGYQFTHWSGTAVDPNVMLDPCAPHTSVIMDTEYSLTAHFRPQDEPWRTVYFNGFEDQVGPEWSHNLVDATPIGERRFLGQFGNDTVTLTLQNLAPHTQVAVSFDLFIIRSWDGYLHSASPDLWSLNVRGGEGLISTNFDNHHSPELNPPPENHRQSYPEGFGTGDFPAQTGAAERNSLGYEFVWQVPTVADAVYCLKFVFPHSDGVLQLDFQGSRLEELENESWGLDNVRVEVFVPVPEVTLTTASTPGGAVVMPGEGVFAYDWGTLVPVEAIADEGCQFTHWTGTAVDANAMLDSSVIHTSVIMDADYSLTAHFEPQEEPWSAAYFNDFEDQVGPEWSHDLVDASPLGARRFLGQFNTNVVTLTLADLPTHSDVRVSFDLFVIRSWDGDGLRGPRGVAVGGGPDLWSLEVGDGPTLLQTTFDNHNTQPYLAFHRQSFPFEYSYGESLPQTDAAEINTLGYVWDFPDTGVTPCDSVYHLECAFPHAAQDLQLVFSALLTEAMNDESWGLDNVRVEVLAGAEPEVTLVVSAMAGGSVAAPGEGAFAYPYGESVPVQAVAAAHYHFTHWSGTAVEAGKVAHPTWENTTVAVDGDYTLVANFKLNQHTLTVSAGPGGSVNTSARMGGVHMMWPDDVSLVLDYGTEVTVTATPYGGWFFETWSGTVGSSASSFTFTLTQDCTLQALFHN
jgi:hypothetical protein